MNRCSYTDVVVLQTFRLLLGVVPQAGLPRRGVELIGFVPDLREPPALGPGGLLLGPSEGPSQPESGWASRFPALKGRAEHALRPIGCGDSDETALGSCATHFELAR